MHAVLLAGAHLKSLIGCAIVAAGWASVKCPAQPAQTMVETAAGSDGFATFGLLQDALRDALRTSGALQCNG